MKPPRYGIVSQLDPAGVRARVRFPELDVDTDKAETGLESPWLAVLQPGTVDTQGFWMPALGALVRVDMDEDWQDGEILGCRYNALDPAPAAPPESRYFKFKDGTILFYDPVAHLLKADVQGDVQAHATGAVDIQAGGQAKLKGATILLDGPTECTGTFKVDGDLTALADVAVTGNGAVGGNWIATGDNSAHHTHPVVGGVALRV